MKMHKEAVPSHTILLRNKTHRENNKITMVFLQFLKMKMKIKNTSLPPRRVIEAAKILVVVKVVCLDKVPSKSHLHIVTKSHLKRRNTNQELNLKQKVLKPTKVLRTVLMVRFA